MDNTTRDGITYLSLCSGYDGIGLGLELAGVRISFTIHVEVETFACWNLVNKIEARAMGPGVLYPDVKSFPFGRFRGTINLLSAGFPCQPFSHAGRGKADADPRHLFPVIKRGIEAACPDWVLLENVDGLISRKLSGAGWGDPAGTPVLLHVLRELERIGYKATWGVFSAAEVGAPHQRKRVFILARRVGPGVQPLLDDDVTGPGFPISGLFWPGRPGRGQWWWEPPRVLRGGELDDPLCNGFWRHVSSDETISDGYGQEDGVFDPASEADGTEVADSERDGNRGRPGYGDGQEGPADCRRQESTGPDKAGDSRSDGTAESMANDDDGGCGVGTDKAQQQAVRWRVEREFEGVSEHGREGSPGVADPNSGRSGGRDTLGQPSNEGRETGESGRTGIRPGREKSPDNAESGSQNRELADPKGREDNGRNRRIVAETAGSRESVNATLGAGSEHGTGEPLADSMCEGPSSERGSSGQQKGFGERGEGQLADPNDDGRCPDGEGNRTGQLAGTEKGQSGTGDKQTASSVGGSRGTIPGSGEQVSLADPHEQRPQGELLKGGSCEEGRQEPIGFTSSSGGHGRGPVRRGGHSLAHPNGSGQRQGDQTGSGQSPEQSGGDSVSPRGTGELADPLRIGPLIGQVVGGRVEGGRSRGQAHPNNGTETEKSGGSGGHDMGDSAGQGLQERETGGQQQPVQTTQYADGEPEVGQTIPEVGGSVDVLAGGMGYAELLESKIIEAIDCGDDELAEALEQELFRISLSRSVDTRTDELRLLGNGVTPPCAASAFRQLYGELEEETNRE